MPSRARTALAGEESYQELVRRCRWQIWVEVTRPRDLLINLMAGFVLTVSVIGRGSFVSWWCGPRGSAWQAVWGRFAQCWGWPGLAGHRRLGGQDPWCGSRGRGLPFSVLWASVVSILSAGEGPPQPALIL